MAYIPREVYAERMKEEEEELVVQTLFRKKIVYTLLEAIYYQPALKMDVDNR